MSTKIYNGYKLPRLSLDELYEFCMNTSKEANKIAENEYNKLAVGALVYRYDTCVTFGDILENQKGDQTEALIWAVIRDEDAENERIRKGIRSPFDMSFSASFIPTKDSILSMIFYEKREIIIPFIESENVSEYMYYDNTDPPENLSEKEWDERRETWDSALKGCDYIIGKVSFNFDFVDNKFFSCMGVIYNKELDINQYVPSLEKRKENIAYQLAIKKKTELDKDDFKLSGLFSEEVKKYKLEYLDNLDFSKLKTSFIAKDFNVQISKKETKDV